MPVIPGSNAIVDDPVETVLNFARVIANDCSLSLAGNLLADTQPYVLPMLNLAWRKLQDRLDNNSIEAFPLEAILTVPAMDPTSFQDPATTCYIDFDGYFNGATTINTVFLPNNLEIPIKVWERTTGSNSGFYPMAPVSDGLPTPPKTGRQIFWEWRNQKIYILGSNQNEDIKIRYKQRYPDFSDPSNVVPLARCAAALAYLMVEIFAQSRGSTILPVFAKEKEDAIKQLINSTTRKKQRMNFRRIPYSRRGSASFTPMFGGGGNSDVPSANFSAVFTYSVTITLPSQYQFLTAQGIGGVAGITLNLPAASTMNGKQITVQKIDNGVGTVLVNCNPGDSINGVGTYTLLTQYQYVTMIADATNNRWVITGNN